MSALARAATAGEYLGGAPLPEKKNRLRPNRPDRREARPAAASLPLAVSLSEGGPRAALAWASHFKFLEVSRSLRSLSGLNGTPSHGTRPPAHWQCWVEVNDFVLSALATWQVRGIRLRASRPFLRWLSMHPSMRCIAADAAYDGMGPAPSDKGRDTQKAGAPE